MVLGLTSDLVAAKGLAAGVARGAYLGLVGVPLQQLRSVGRVARFPNPHLRSNAFLLRRSLFVEFAAQARFPRTKRDTHRLESGRKGLTRFMQSRGLAPVVVGRDHQAYASAQWIEARTFRTPGQPNLLISDNQTRSPGKMLR